jgi:hypothetical protein
MSILTLRPRLHICAARNLGIKRLECTLARFGDYVVDRQFEEPQVFWRKVIPIAGALKNIMERGLLARPQTRILSCRRWDVMLSNEMTTRNRSE